MSSWVRPGVFDVRARPERPVSALMSEDLPTFERPAKATSGGPTGGSALGLRGGEEEIAGTREELPSRFRPVLQGLGVGHTLGVFAGLRAKSLVRLSQSSTLTPALLMM